MLGGFFRDFVCRAGRLVQFHALVAAAFNALFNPHEDEGPDGLGAGVATPDPAKQRGNEKQAKGTDNQHPREQDEIFRVKGGPV